MAVHRPTIEILKEWVELACHAPSVHNSQPWRWVFSGGDLHLELDTDRLVATDPSRRQALISCGAVLDHLGVAAAATGWRILVDYLPNPNDPLFVASVGFTPMTYVTVAHRRRAAAILTRRSDRLPFRSPQNWPALQLLLSRAAEGRPDEDSAAIFDVLSHDDRTTLAEASRLSEALRQYDSDYHAELDWWTGPFGDSDGIPHASLVSATEGQRVDVGRSFPVTHHSRDRRTEIAQDRSEIVVLSTYSNTRRDVVCCGQALSRVLLEAEMSQLSTCPLTHVLEVDVSRDMVRSLVHRDHPQVLVRVGQRTADDDQPAPTPRRPIDDVFTVRV